MGGDRMADFDALFDEYNDKVYGLAYRLMGDRDDAMDISQEVFVKIFRNLKAFKGESTLATWIYRIVYNTCMDELRRRKIKQVSIADKPDLVDDNISVEEIYEADERKKAVHNALYKLDDDQRAVIVMRDIQGLSYEEIADVLQCPLGTVKSRLSRARFNLKEILKDYMELFDEVDV
ncbi:RNA polymerase sigma factor [Mahella australiensis]|uniref:RNA polymerase, sigma-24 subunit, ECF subfamily n=1 Tax=Mahella australiensis (strain DSM 15567 / CIP 107919 / 50-1 BON) TaxID=697281 RepID=F3ZVL0_MAHA5|nr:sigma-70 family RNA polymerase sigma factor [Mahella australiensis]AEE96372.1 RNA polymerase, sigma-24 subunit, ECF subfamily [Mahella australiensis 50-1 BON]